jgi:hypothetical protein
MVSTRCEGMSVPTTWALPLSRAVLCVDCEVVFRIEALACPCCGSKSFILLALALGYARQEQKRTHDEQ